MKNVRVEYSVEATVNTGDFQNVKPGFKVSATLEDNEKPHEVKAKLVKAVDQWLEVEVNRIRNDEK